MAGSSSDSDLVLVKKKNATSIVRDHFRLKATACGRVIDSEASHPVYFSCKKSIPAKGGNTNLLVYLRDRHPDLYYQVYPKIFRKKGVVALAPGQLLYSRLLVYLSQPLLILLFRY